MRNVHSKLVAAMAAGLSALGLTGAQLPARADVPVYETTGSVAHTWTNFTNAGGDEGPTIANHQAVAIACKVRGFQVQDGNTWWYRVASAPWNSRYYVSADAFYNGAPTSGSLKGTPFVDTAVPDCGAPAPQPDPSTSQPEPATAPAVHLSQGPPASSGYRYAITVSGFPTNVSLTVSCRDSADPNGFFAFTLATDQAGSASTDRQCYSNDGPDHWVVADGIPSNTATWTSRPSSAGGSDGFSPNSPTDSSPEQHPASGPPTSTPDGGSQTAAPPPACIKPQGFYISNRFVAARLYGHYLEGTGSTVVLDWSFFSSDGPFVQRAKQIQGSGPWRADPVTNREMFASLGTFTIVHEHDKCYSIRDHYDFDPDYSSWPKRIFTVLTAPAWAAQTRGARTFDVVARGIIS